MTAGDDLGAEGFSVAVHREGNRAVVAVAGELDLHTAGELTAAVTRLLQQEVERIELDAGRLTFADSAGLRAVLIARAAADDASVAFGVTDASGTVERLIEITGLSDLLAGEASKP